MTGGGPQDVTQTFMLLLVQDGFTEQRIGQASAIAVSLLPHRADPFAHCPTRWTADDRGGADAAPIHRKSRDRRAGDSLQPVAGGGVALFLAPLVFMLVASVKPDNDVLAESDSLAAFWPSSDREQLRSTHPTRVSSDADW